MISVTVIALGKLKESYMRDFCAEYEKRLKAFCKINITELSPVRLSQNPSEGEIKKALDSEAALIKSKIPSGAYVFSMYTAAPPGIQWFGEGCRRSGGERRGLPVF